MLLEPPFEKSDGGVEVGWRQKGTFYFFGRQKGTFYFFEQRNTGQPGRQKGTFYFFEQRNTGQPGERKWPAFESTDCDHHHQAANASDEMIGQEALANQPNWNSLLRVTHHREKREEVRVLGKNIRATIPTIQDMADNFPSQRTPRSMPFFGSKKRCRRQ